MINIACFISLLKKISGPQLGSLRKFFIQKFLLWIKQRNKIHGYADLSAKSKMTMRIGTVYMIEKYPLHKKISLVKYEFSAILRE